jgi:hypothetical protein
MTMLKSRTALCMLLLPVTSYAAAVEPQLPTPGCYTVDWAARDEMRANGQLSRVMTSSIEGLSGFYRTTLEAPGQAPSKHEFAGAGPFYKQFARLGPNAQITCPGTSAFDGSTGFDISLACKYATVDPAKLSFVRVPGSIEKWEVSLSLVSTSQIGLNNVSDAQRDNAAMMEKILANAQPRTQAEREQIAKQRAALANMQRQQAQNDQNIERLRRQMEEKAQTGTAEERAGIEMALTGPVTEHTTRINEVWNWAGSTCPSD